MAPTSQLEKADCLAVNYIGPRLKREEANVKAQSDAQKPSNGAQTRILMRHSSSFNEPSLHCFNHAILFRDLLSCCHGWRHQCRVKLCSRAHLVFMEARMAAASNAVCALTNRSIGSRRHGTMRIEVTATERSPNCRGETSNSGAANVTFWLRKNPTASCHLTSSSEVRGVDLTRFSGHITVTQRGVQNVEERQ